MTRSTKLWLAAACAVSLASAPAFAVGTTDSSGAAATPGTTHSTDMSGMKNGTKTMNGSATTGMSNSGSSAANSTGASGMNKTTGSQQAANGAKSGTWSKNHKTGTSTTK